MDTPKKNETNRRRIESIFLLVPLILVFLCVIFYTLPRCMQGSKSINNEVKEMGRTPPPLFERRSAEDTLQFLLFVEEPDWYVRSNMYRMGKQVEIGQDKAHIVPYSQVYQDFIRDFTLLSVSSIALLISLFFLLQKQRQLQFEGISWSGYFKYYFPEEVLAELAALEKKLTKEKKSTYLIRCLLLLQILTLIWAFGVQIKIDNLWLPNRDRRIDD